MLYCAVDHGVADIVTTLLRAGVAIETRTTSGSALLICAPYQEVVKVLLKWEADIHVNNGSALVRALSQGHHGVA